MTGGPRAAYRARIEAGEIVPDAAQARAVDVLEDLHRALAGYQPRAAGGLLARLGLRRDQAGAPPTGVYLHGGVGRGKSMLMDLFFATAPVPPQRRRRVHFHAFMLELHARLHAWRQGNRDKRESDPLPRIAAEMMENAWLLCFDEFQVTNVADAMILRRLFEALLARGVVVVATSNRAPDDLYLHGLQRERFLPFVDLLKERCRVVEVAGETDYRLRRLAEMDVYFTPLDGAAEAALDACFQRLTEDEAGERVEAGPLALQVQGREVTVPLAARGTACFTFEGLCGQPLGAADYLAIAREFHTVILRGIPAMDPASCDKAARFITLIDALYEHRVKLVCSAAAEPRALYAQGDNAFEFQRTASRLIEMQSKEYKALEHVTGGAGERLALGPGAAD